MRNRLLVGAVFLVGCAVGGVSSQVVVPRASAQQAAALTKWEMVCVNIFDRDIDDVAANATQAGNRFGSEGWEPLGGIDTVACFKRPKM
jgi:hypothetical protein